jgi:hypothetical protein
MFVVVNKPPPVGWALVVGVSGKRPAKLAAYLRLISH